MAEIYGERKRLRDIKTPREFYYWWVNYFWYNYKYVVYVVGGILIIAGIFTADMLARVVPDVRFPLVTEHIIPAEFTEEARAYLEDGFRDINGDGTVYVSIEALGRQTEAMDQYGMAAQQKFVVGLNEPELIIYLVDAHNRDFMVEMDLLMPLTEAGIAYESEDGYSTEITNARFVNMFAVDWQALDMRFYAVVKKSDLTDALVAENLALQKELLDYILSEADETLQ